MTPYALVKNNAIVQYGALPKVWNDGTRDWDLRPMNDTQLATLGWLPVVTTARPADTATDTHDYSVALVSSKPTEVWTKRAKTQVEKDSATSEANTQSMLAESETSIDKLIAVVENLNTMTAVSNATINANPASYIKDLAREVKTVARQANREARLTTGSTESTNTGSGSE